MKFLTVDGYFLGHLTADVFLACDGEFRFVGHRPKTGVRVVVFRKKEGKRDKKSNTLASF